MSSKNIHEKIWEIRHKLLGDISKGEIKKSTKGARGLIFGLKDIIPRIEKYCTDYRVLLLFSFPVTGAKLEAVNLDDREDRIITMSPLPDYTNNNNPNIMQEIGKAETYTRRYLYYALFSIEEIDEIELESADKIDSKSSNDHSRKDDLKDVFDKIISELKAQKKEVNRNNIMLMRSELVKNKKITADESRQVVVFLKNNKEVYV